MSNSEHSGEHAVKTMTPPIPKPVFENLINPIIKALLRSPFHGLLSDSLLLITFTGRKTGRTYSTPVGYEEHDGSIFITSQTDRVWWKNLRGGVDVTIRLRGADRTCSAEVLEDNDGVADYVIGYVDRHGLDRLSRLALSLEGDELPDSDTLANDLDGVVVIKLTRAEEDQE